MLRRSSSISSSSSSSSSLVLTSLLSLLVSVLLLLPHGAQASFAPFAANNLTTVASPVDPGITISYKAPTAGACTTAFDTQQQYTGWVSVPTTSANGTNYTSHIFFWFVAARVSTPLLTVWLNGGPGSSSMFGFFAESGPCEVVEKGLDRLGTVPREWGWDRASNMLFIDQPDQVGFSYDEPTNGTMDLTNGEVYPLDEGVSSSANDNPWTVLNGTFGSQSVDGTANTTETAALAIWHLMQGFLGTFPQFNPPNTTSLGVNLFAESYGGKYGPVFADVWEEQNLRRRNGSLSNSTVDIHLAALGIVNGCVDDLIQGPSYATMAVNNTYGLQTISPLRAQLQNASFYAAGGCRDLIYQCRNASAQLDPSNSGAVDSVNSVCSDATSTCNDQLMDAYGSAGRSFYDIAHQLPESFPPSYYVDYLNSRAVQDAIGAVVNYTDTSEAVYEAFASTGDWERGPNVPKMAALLDRGVRVGLMYGDRDFICNWMGGEAVSLNIASLAGGAYPRAFPAAGYAPIIVNNSYVGGVVRQYGNLSFARVYQAGHFVPAYQPETAFQVFARVAMGTSVSTGEPADLSLFNTTGPLSAAASGALPPSPSATCYLRAMADSCPDEAVSSIRARKGVVINGVWYSASSAWPGFASFAAASSESVATATLTTGGAGGIGGSTVTTTTQSPTLTGWFTATSTPTNAAVPGVRPANTGVLGLWLGLSVFAALW